MRIASGKNSRLKNKSSLGVSFLPNKVTRNHVVLPFSRSNKVENDKNQELQIHSIKKIVSSSIGVQKRV
jgi:hypothetical protein